MRGNLKECSLSLCPRLSVAVCPRAPASLPLTAHAAHPGVQRGSPRSLSYLFWRKLGLMGFGLVFWDPGGSWVWDPGGSWVLISDVLEGARFSVLGFGCLNFGGSWVCSPAGLRQVGGFVPSIPGSMELHLHVPAHVHFGNLGEDGQVCSYCTF